MPMIPNRLVTMASALAITLFAPLTLAQQTLVINSFGGDYEKTHRALVITPFEKANNVKVQVVTAYSADAVAQLRAQKERPQFDIVHLSGGLDATAAGEGLLQPITPAQLTNYKDLYPIAVEKLASGRGPMYHIAVIGLLYNTQKANPAPTSWKDVLDKRFAGHLVLTDVSNQWGMLSFLMLNRVMGGGFDNFTPGLGAIKQTLGGATIVSKSPEIQQAFAQSDAWLAPYAQDYAFTLTKAGLPVKFLQPSEGAPIAPVTINLVRGRPNNDLALKFIDYTLRPEVQAGWANALRYSPVNKQSKLAPEVAAEVTVGDAAMSKLVEIDAVQLSAKRSEITEAWKRAIAK
jgi:putative spermidine/putrescine transport system substrate-binding protein